MRILLPASLMSSLIVPHVELPSERDCTTLGTQLSCCPETSRKVLPRTQCSKIPVLLDGHLDKEADSHSRILHSFASSSYQHQQDRPHQQPYQHQYQTTRPVSRPTFSMRFTVLIAAVFVGLIAPALAVRSSFLGFIA